MSEARFDGIDRRLDGIDRRLDTVDTRFDQIDERFDELSRHMDVLHEDTISRIAAISEEPLATRAEMNKGFAELKELISRSIGPLELAVRHLLLERNNRA